MGGVTVEGATWCRGYLPVVGDRVAVLAGDSGWLILDAVEPVKRAYNEPETILVRPTHLGQLRKPLWSSSWDDDPLAPGPHPVPKLPESLDMDWQGLRSYTASGSPFEQVGYYYVQSGGEWVNYIPQNGYAAAPVWYPRLDSQVPSNAVIQSVSLVLRMWNPSPSIVPPFLPAVGAPIVIYAHDQGPSAELRRPWHAPDQAPSHDPRDPGHPPDHLFAPGYDPIEVGVSDPGGTIVTPLPDSWVTGLAEGSLRGLFAWPGETQQYVVLSDHNTYQWYTSPISGNSYWRGTPVTDDCLALQVTYITPFEED